MRALVEWFLRDSGAEFGPFDRRRLLVQGALACGFVSAAFVLHRFVLEPGFDARHVNVIGASALLWSCPFVLRGTGSLRLAAHLLAGGLTAFVAVDCWIYGGLGAPPTIALMVVPLVAVFFLGTRAGIAYGLACGAVVVALFFLELGGRLGEPPAPEQLIRMRLFALVGVLGFITLLAAFYEAERNAAVLRSRAIVDNLVDAVLAIDHTGRVVVANRSSGAQLGLDAPVADTLSGRLASEVLPEPIAELAAQCVQAGETCTARVTLPDERVVAVVASPIELDDGRHAGTVVIVRDVTVEASVDRMKTDFIATVSHEMRTPLTSVLGFAKLIRTKLDADVFPRVPAADERAARTMRKVRSNLGIIVEEGERLTNLIGDVLDIAKLESGQMEWHMQEVDVAALVERAIDATGGLFTDRDVRLAGGVAEDLPTLRGDAQRLLQVLINLISNASKFTDEGTVTLAAAGVDGHVELRVADTGAGIPEGDQARIFDRFRQAGDTLLDKPRGTGLGLPICVEIVHAHGGTIRVESEVGEGSTFIVKLPVDPPARSAPVD